MITRIKNYLKKYHEANLWLAERMVLEEKKQAIQATPEPEAQEETMWLPAAQSGQVIFSHYDSGHDLEERSKIQQLYTELENLVKIPGLAIG